MIKLVIADDQPLIRAGLRMMFDTESDIDVIGEASNGVAVVDLCRRFSPTVAVLDIRMPIMDGIQAIPELLALPNLEKPRILVLTTFDDDDYVYRALRAGASGFLLKDAPPEQIVAGVRTVASGEALLAPTITRRLIANFTTPHRPSPNQPAPWAELTERELVVLRLVARGLSNGEIATQLYLGESTVKTHVSHILLKLGLRDRVQAVVLAYDSGLVQPGGPPL